MNSGKTILGLLTGAVAGAAIGLLFAPKKGKETRRAIANTSEDYLEKFSKKADELKASVEDKLDELKDKSPSVSDNQARERIAKAKAEIDQIKAN